MNKFFKGEGKLIKQVLVKLRKRKINKRRTKILYFKLNPSD